MPNLIKEIEILTELVKKNQNSLLLGRLADNYFKMGIFDEAKFNCSLLLGKEPENISARIVLVNVLITTRGYEEALKELEELERVAPNLAMTFELKAKIYKKKAKNALALEAFRNALQRNKFNLKYATEIKNFEVAASLDSLIEKKSSAVQETSNIAAKEILEKPIGEIQRVEEAQEAQTKILARLKNLNRKQENTEENLPEIFEEEIISAECGLPPLKELTQESLENTETEVYEIQETFEGEEFPPSEEETHSESVDTTVVQEAKILQNKRLERLKAILEAKETQNSQKLSEFSQEETEVDLEDSSELPPLDSKVKDEIPDENFGLGDTEDFKSVLSEVLQGKTEEYSEDFINFEEENLEEFFEPKFQAKESEKIESEETKPSLDSKGQINSLHLVKIYAEQELYDKAISILKSRKDSEKTSNYDDEIKNYEKLWKELQDEAERKKTK